jgi:hypothetical protein
MTPHGAIGPRQFNDASNVFSSFQQIQRGQNSCTLRVMIARRSQGSPYQVRRYNHTGKHQLLQTPSEGLDPDDHCGDASLF